MSDANEVKHTPLPWHYQEGSDPYTHIVRDPTGHQIVATAPQDSRGNSEADCRLIVAAVNSYPSRQRLVDALEKLLKYCPLSGDMAVMIRAIQGGGEEASKRADALVEHCSHLDEAQDEARTALADIGGEK